MKKRVLLNYGFGNLSLPCEAMPFLSDVEIVEDKFIDSKTVFVPAEDQELRIKLIDESEIRRDRVEVLNEKAQKESEYYRRRWEQEEERREQLQRELKELKGEG